VIQIQNISKDFGSQTLFKEAGFLVAPGERVGVIGRNGSGKSTLFKSRVPQVFYFLSIILLLSTLFFVFRSKT
jgi:ABC-type Mn2+/Zn2+ transport system ATPase subunit